MANFRTYILSTGRKIVGGRSAENNDELVKSSKRNDTIFHTKEPGSPFVNAGENPSKKELKEAAIFCAKYSQIWRDRKADVIINVFKRSDMKKGIFMKTGTWKVKKSEVLKVKMADVEGFKVK